MVQLSAVYHIAAVIFSGDNHKAAVRNLRCQISGMLFLDHIILSRQNQHRLSNPFQFLLCNLRLHQHQPDLRIPVEMADQAEQLEPFLLYPLGIGIPSAENQL